MAYYEESMRPKNTRTVIVFDRNAKFKDLSNEPFDLNVKEGAKVRTVASCKKSIWAWCMEGVFEMHRVLSDTFPLGEPLIRFAVSDTNSRLLDTEWGNKLVSREDMKNLLKTIKGVSTESNISPIGGLMLAIDAIGSASTTENKLSEVERFKTEIGNEKEKVEDISNAGNIILFTRYKTNEEVEKLEDEVSKLLEARNKMTATNSSIVPLSRVRLFIVNFYPLDEECTVKTRPLVAYPKLASLETWVISRRAGQMADAIHSVVISAFRLISTTVTKIPMKEDNRSSANYDVELFHVKPVHSLLKKLGIIKNVNSKAFSTEGVTYETTRLAWATVSKIKWSLFACHRTIAPVTSVEAYTRQSACLTQFVMDGRCVLLDLERCKAVRKFPNNVGKFLISHMLKVNKGRIFIHEINFIPKKHLRNIKQLLPPEPSATIERLNNLQFKHIFDQMKLTKVEINHLQSNHPDYDPFRTKEATEKLLKLTKNAPLLLKDTFLFQAPVMKNFEPLLTIITKTELSDVDVENCNANIHKLHEKREQNVHLVPVGIQLQVSTVKNMSDAAEQMRIGLVEMSRYLANFKSFSEKHSEVYEFYMNTLGIYKLIKAAPEEADLDEHIARLWQSSQVKPRESLAKKLSDFIRTVKEDGEICDDDEEDGNEPSTKRARMDGRIKKEMPIIFGKPLHIDLMKLMCDNHEAHVSKTRRDFVGRELYGDKAKLYVSLENEENRAKSERGASGTPPPQQQRRFQQ